VARVVRSLVALLLTVVCVTAVPADADAGPCSLSTGAAVVLRASDFDPDVLVWDSRQREMDYDGGNLKDTAEVLSHTLLSAPGTRAVVVACDPGSSKPRYAPEPEDTIGIKITSGPNRGRYGWVSSGDAHPAPPAHARLQ
jgi:hypothetical protein